MGPGEEGVSRGEERGAEIRAIRCVLYNCTAHVLGKARGAGASGGIPVDDRYKRSNET